MALKAHPFTQRDLSGLIALAQRVTAARAPRPSYYHPGDVCWQLYAEGASDDVGVWTDHDGIARALAIYERPSTFQFMIDPSSDADASDAVLAWAEERRGRAPTDEPLPRAYSDIADAWLATWMTERDDERARMLERHGYERGPVAGVRFGLELDADPPAPSLPPGARFRTIGDDAADIEARAELHRDAWSAWGPSQHSSARYRRLRASLLYDPQLDVVLEYEGVLASYCVCWLDDVNGIGLFEPVGTRPSMTQRGFAHAVLHEALRRLRARGMRRAVVGTNAQNAPARALYASAGFRTVEREYYAVKRRP